MNNNANVSSELLGNMAVFAQESKEALHGPVADMVGGWVAGQYAGATHAKVAGADSTQRWEILRKCVQDVSKLRRSDHAAARLQLEQEQFDWKRTKHEASTEQQFRAWFKRPEVRRELFAEIKAGLLEDGSGKGAI